MTNEKDQDLTSSSQQKLTKYSSDLIKKGLGLAKSIHPSDNTPEYWRLKGNDFFRSGNFEEALACYEQALNLDPLYSLAWNNRGSVMGYLERYEDALKAFTKAVEIDPNNDLAWRNRAKILGGKFKRYEEAVYSYDKVLEIDENDCESWWLRGTELEQLKRYEEASDSYQRALIIKPNQWFVWLSYGNNLNLNMKQYNQSLLCYDKALEFFHSEEVAYPSLDKVEEYVIWMTKGQVLSNLKLYEEAFRNYQKALEFEPNEHKAYLWLQCANQLYNLNLHTEAIDYLNIALQFETDEETAGTIWFNKAQILMESKSYEDAILSFDEALKYDSNNVKAWNNRGRILEEFGYYKEALDSYQKALEIDPNYELTLANAVRLIGILNKIIESQVNNLTTENWKCIRTSAYFKNRCLQHGFSSQYGVADIELSSNGKFLAAIDTRGHLCIWNLEDNQKITEVNLSIANQLSNILKYGKHTYIEDRFYYSFKKKFNHVRESYFENLVNQIAQTDLSQLPINIKSEIVDLIGEQCYRLAVSSDNKYLFGINGYSIITWKINSGEQVCHIKREYNDISLDRDKKIAIIPFVYGLEIWNLLTGQLEKTLTLNSDNNGYLCFTESLQIDDSGKYVSCNLMVFDKVLSKFPRCISGEYEVGLLLSKEPSFLNFVRSINSKTMNQLVVENLNLRQILILWDVETGKTVFLKEDQSQLNPGNRASANLDLENQVIIGLFGNQVEVIDIALENVYTVPVLYPAVNFEIKVSDGFMFIFDNDKQKFTDGVYIYNLENKTFKNQLDSSTDIFSNNIIDMTTHSILVGCADSSIQIWNYLTGETKAIVSGHNQYVSTISNIAETADKKIFVSSGDDRLIKVWSY